MEKLEKQAWQWISEKPENVEIASENYCKTRDIFQARLEKMTNYLLKSGEIEENKTYITAAIVGEIGNNSFDHNLGSWRDIALADRGQGIFTTLKKVKPELANDKDALRVAFTEVISGRAPEARGNGLKFVRENVKAENIYLKFYSGKAEAELNHNFTVNDSEKEVKGCLAILEVPK